MYDNRCCKWQYFLLFYDSVIVHCMYVPHLLNPFIGQRTFRLLFKLLQGSVLLTYLQCSVFSVFLFIYFFLFGFLMSFFESPQFKQRRTSLHPRCSSNCFSPSAHPPLSLQSIFSALTFFSLLILFDMYYLVTKNCFGTSTCKSQCDVVTTILAVLQGTLYR